MNVFITYGDPEISNGGPSYPRLESDRGRGFDGRVYSIIFSRQGIEGGLMHAFSSALDKYLGVELDSS